MNKRIKAFEKAINKHGLTIDAYSGGHYKIRRNGALVGTLAHTGEENSLRQCVRDLVRDGVLPSEVKRLKFG